MQKAQKNLLKIFENNILNFYIVIIIDTPKISRRAKWNDETRNQLRIQHFHLIRAE